MTSNLPVVGVEQALSGHLASAAVERGLTRPHGVGGGTSLYAGGAPASALAGVDSEFARVLFEVMTADAHPRVAGAFPGESPPAGTSGDPGQLLRALAADARLEWVAAPLVHRAIDAYRELMNVAV